jgi:hypothetical protein
MIHHAYVAGIAALPDKLLDKTRNPLAFVHGGLNLILAQMMGKPRGFISSAKRLPSREGGKE